MSIATSRPVQIAILGLVSLALVFVIARPDPATSIRKINESLAGRKEREEGSPVSIELINSGAEIELRFTNLSDRDLTIYPPDVSYSVHLEFFDSAGEAFQPETIEAVTLPKPTEQNLVTIGPQETLVSEVSLEHIEEQMNIDKAAFVIARYEVSEFVREALGDADYDLRQTCIFSNVGAL